MELFYFLSKEKRAILEALSQNGTIELESVVVGDSVASAESVPNTSALRREAFMQKYYPNIMLKIRFAKAKISAMPPYEQGMIYPLIFPSIIPPAATETEAYTAWYFVPYTTDKPIFDAGPIQESEHIHCRQISTTDIYVEFLDMGANKEFEFRHGMSYNSADYFNETSKHLPTYDILSLEQSVQRYYSETPCRVIGAKWWDEKGEMEYIGYSNWNIISGAGIPGKTKEDRVIEVQYLLAKIPTDTRKRKPKAKRVRAVVMQNSDESKAVDLILEPDILHTNGPALQILLNAAALNVLKKKGDEVVCSECGNSISILKETFYERNPLRILTVAESVILAADNHYLCHECMPNKLDRTQLEQLLFASIFDF